MVGFTHSITFLYWSLYSYILWMDSLLIEMTSDVQKCRCIYVSKGIRMTRSFMFYFLWVYNQKLTISVFGQFKFFGQSPWCDVIYLKRLMNSYGKPMNHRKLNKQWKKCFKSFKCPSSLPVLVKFHSVTLEKRNQENHQFLHS